MEDRRLSAFNRLLNIMDELREKCPWDRKQTIETLRKLTIEETYELADAIIEKDYNEIKKELGDLMLHIVFYAKIGEEKNKFDITDVLEEICDKLVYRHPHIYSDVKVANERDVADNWEKLKIKKDKNKSVLEGVPKSLPALVKANRIQEKVRGVGFDWDKREQIWDKVNEELKEVKDEINLNNSQERIEEEFGDLFFSIINAARLYEIDPENALERTNRKFIRRFKHMEKLIKEKNLNLTEMKLEEMEYYWNKSKIADKADF